MLRRVGGVTVRVPGLPAACAAELLRRKAAYCKDAAKFAAEIAETAGRAEAGGGG